MGILVSDHIDSMEVLIPFEEPITNLLSPSDGITPIYEVALSISPGEHAGILVKVAGQVI